MATICFTKISSEIKKGKTLSDFIERSGIFSFYCFDPGVSFNKLKKNMYKRRICIFRVFANTLDLPMYQRYMYIEEQRWFCIHKKITFVYLLL